MECNSASLELAALRQEKGNIEGCLEATSQDLRSKQEKLNAFEVSVTFV